jgi:hypothetical protein
MAFSQKPEGLKPAIFYKLPGGYYDAQFTAWQKTVDLDQRFISDCIGWFRTGSIYDSCSNSGSSSNSGQTDHL